MNKNIIILSISVIFVIALALACIFRDGGRYMGKVIDAKVVRKVPEGFIPLREAAKWEGSGDSESGLRYVTWESQISFLDADLGAGGTTIYQTSFNDSDFIVKHNNEYYVNEEKILELIDITNRVNESKILELIDRANSRKRHYTIHHDNGRYYYMDLLSNRRRWIAFEDGLALINEHIICEGSVVEQGRGIWRYIDAHGNVVLNPDVYIADAFSEGLAAVMPFEGSNWGYINKNGEMVIGPQFRRASMFQDGLASVYIDGRWALINIKGEHIRDIDEPLNWRSYRQGFPGNMPVSP